MRRVWIEITCIKHARAEAIVTLRAEGVDRNALAAAVFAAPAVTLRAEGVDRNDTAAAVRREIFTSPSVRRVWIEI